MKVLNFKAFMTNYKLINDTMNESQIQLFYKYPIHPRDSKVYSDKAFINIDKRSQNGTHWTCFIVKDNKSFYFDPFGGTSNKFPLNQLPKPIVYHK